MTTTATPTLDPPSQPSGSDGLWPRASVRVQLFAAALVWLVGASVLLVRGIAFLHDRWVPLIIATAILIGLAKERYILNNYARKAVVRIHRRGKAFLLGMFSLKSWIFIIVMMGGGIALRHSVLADPHDTIRWGRDALAVLYVAVGTGLLMADRIYWQAAVAKTPAQLETVEHETD